ncbi:MAG: chromate transporter [Burkholderiales bacterium]|nr:chromate transporter [Burkholderiales bacterium]
MSEKPEPSLNPNACPVAGNQEIFTAFAQVGLSGFGGVLPWVRRTVVEQKHWLSPAEFNATLGLCQLVPGPSILSLAICVGHKLNGWQGALAGFSGLLFAPLFVVLLLAQVYAQTIHHPEVAGLLRGISAVGIGLLASTALKMLREGLLYKKSLLITVPMFFALVVAQLPLHWVIAATLPFAIMMAGLRIRKEDC